MELTQGNEPRAFDVTLIPLLLLADVDQIDVVHGCKLGGRHVVRIHWIAESFIVDEMCDRRPRPADCAIRIFLEAQRTKLHPQRIEEKKTSDQRLADTGDQFDRLRRLDRADDSRKHA